MVEPHFRRRKSDTQKEIVREILREWLDEQFAKFGKWSLRAIGAVVFILVIHGKTSIKMSEIKLLLESYEHISN